MAGSATVKIGVNISGLDEDVDINQGFKEIMPLEYLKHYAVIGNTSSNLDLGSIALTDVYGLWIRADIGNVYIKLNDTSTELTDANCTILIEEGKSNYISVNGANNAGIRINGSSASAKISYLLLGA